MSARHPIFGALPMAVLFGCVAAIIGTALAAAAIAASGSPEGPTPVMDAEGRPVCPDWSTRRRLGGETVQCCPGQAMTVTDTHVLCTRGGEQ